MIEYTTNGEKMMTAEEKNALKEEAIVIIIKKEIDIPLIKHCHGANHYNALSYNPEITEEEYLKVRQAINVIEICNS